MQSYVGHVTGQRPQPDDLADRTEHTAQARRWMQRKCQNKEYFESWTVYFSRCRGVVGLITREPDKEMGTCYLDFLKVMAKPKQLVSKQMDSSLATSVSVSVF